MKTVEGLSEDEFATLVRRAVALPAASPGLVFTASYLLQLQPPPSLSSIARRALRALNAALTFDSWATDGVTVGMRSGTTTTRQLVFNAMGRDIDLRIARDVGSFSISGQILGIAPGVAEVTIEASNNVNGIDIDVGRLPIDACGEFRLAPLYEGDYRVTFNFDGETVRLPEIHVA
jgi:hypothetical protein